MQVLSMKLTIKRFLSATKIDWIPNPQNPGLLDFSISLIRASALSYSILYIIYLIKYQGERSYSFNSSENLIFILIFAFFEEHARWIFSANSSTPAKSCLKFFIYIIFVELTLTSLLAYGINAKQYAAIRAGSVIVHAVNGWLFFKCLKSSRPLKIMIFFIATAFHCAMNFYASNKIADFILRFI